MKIVIFLQLVLLTIVSKQQAIVPISKQLMFVPDIPNDYSIASQIYNKIHDQQVEKTRPKDLKQTTKLPSLSQIENVVNKFKGFADEARARLNAPIPSIINLPSTQFAHMPPTSPQTANSPAKAIFQDNRNPLFKQPNLQFKMQKNINFQQQKLVQLKEDRAYVLNRIEDKKVVQDDGSIVKVNVQKLEKVLENSNKDNGINQVNGNIKSNQNQKQKQTQIQRQRQDTTNKQQNNNLNQPKQPKHPQPIKLQPIIKPPNLQNFQSLREKQQKNQQRMLKIIFTSLLVIAILFIFFSSSPHQSRDSELMKSKDDEENQLN